MILFIDDEGQMESYQMGLTLSNLETKLITSADKAWEYFLEHRSEIQLVILDISMSPGAFLEEMNTERGLRTGVFLFEKIRNEAPILPVIIFSIVSDSQVIERFSKDLHCLALRKDQEMPHTLVEKVRRMLAA